MQITKEDAAQLAQDAARSAVLQKAALDHGRAMEALQAQGDNGAKQRPWYDAFRFKEHKPAFRFLKNRVQRKRVKSCAIDQLENGSWRVTVITSKAPADWTPSYEREMRSLAAHHNAVYLGWKCGFVETPEDQ